MMVRGNMYKVDLIRSDDKGPEMTITRNQLKVSNFSINNCYEGSCYSLKSLKYPGI